MRGRAGQQLEDDRTCASSTCAGSRERGRCTKRMLRPCGSTGVGQEEGPGEVEEGEEKSRSTNECGNEEHRVSAQVSTSHN